VVGDEAFEDANHSCGRTILVTGAPFRGRGCVFSVGWVR
jgi:hypothetical protein